MKARGLYSPQKETNMDFTENKEWKFRYTTLEDLEAQKAEGLNPRIHCGESIPQKPLDIDEGN